MKLLSGAPLLGRLLAFPSNDLAKLERLATNTLAYFLIHKLRCFKVYKIDQRRVSNKKKLQIKKKRFFFKSEFFFSSTPFRDRARIES
jgi:hypothetical protein